MQYQRDSSGKIVQVVEQVLGASATLGFAYDSVGRLVTVSRNGVPEAAYEYDANGNRTRAVGSTGDAAGVYDSRDRLVTWGATSYDYTPDGFLSSRALGADTTAFRFAALGELLEVRLPGGTRIEYVVDARGRRIGKKVNSIVTRGWLYSGDVNIAAELDAQGQVVSRFVYGDEAESSNVPAYMIKGGRTYRIMTDQVGSVRLVVDVASGDVAQQLTYDPFGRVLSNTNPGFQPFGFAGGLYDDDTRLTHFGWRDYDADAGRWISRDPILFRGGDDNLYAYAGNDPVNRRDPLGLNTLPEENAAMDTNEELEKDNYQRVDQQRRNVLKTVCKTVTTLAKTTAQVHHVLFKALGGGDPGNRVWITTEIHRAFHRYMYSVFANAGLEPLNTAAEKWRDIVGQPGPQREAVKAALRAGADAFDKFCKDRARLVIGPGRGDIGGVTTMRSVLEQYFKDIGWE